MSTCSLVPTPGRSWSVSASTPEQGAASADLLILGGRVWTGVGEESATAIAIAGDRIVAVGTDGELRPLAGPRTRVIDVAGRRVIPGLVDSHLHLVRAGLRWARDVRWEGVASLEEAMERLADAARSRGDGEWIAVLGGWHPGQFAEGRPPNRADLDTVAPRHPVYVQRAYAEAFVNTLAIERLANIPGLDPQAGIVTGPAGLASATAALGMPDAGEQVAGTRAMMHDLNAVGLTGVVDAGGFGMAPDRYHALFEVWRRGEMTVRTRLLVGPPAPGAETDRIEEWTRFVHPGFGDDRLRYLGAGEVLLFAAHDMEGVDGRDVRDQVDDLAAVSARLAEGSWPVHIHAIVDTSITAVLDAWERVAATHDLASLRWAITHAEQISPRNIARVADLGVALTVQHRLSYRARDTASAWGEALVTAAPPLRVLREAGIPMAAGTDGTVASSYDPWRCLHWLVTGEQADGGPRRLPEHRLSREEALRLYTAGSAWCSFEEHRRGMLAPGALADVVVLAADYLSVPEARIPDIRSVLTIVGGAVVHGTLP